MSSTNIIVQSEHMPSLYQKHNVDIQACPGWETESSVMIHRCHVSKMKDSDMITMLNVSE